MRNTVKYVYRPVCHTNVRTIHKIEESGTLFEIVYCDQCQRAYTNPYPSEETVGFLYEGRESVCNFDFISGSIVDTLKDYFGKREILALIPKHDRMNVNRVLDFGTGNGRYAVLSSKLFPSAVVDAVDYQRDAPLNFSAKRVNYLYVEDFWKTSYQYDLIILRHVLEHNHNPQEFLTNLGERLTGHGLLYVEVPNLQSWYALKANKWVNSFAVPFHIFHYSTYSLRNVINASNMECRISFKEMPHMGGIVQSTLHVDRSILTQLAGIALNPLQLIFSMLYGKPCITAICKKKNSNESKMVSDAQP